MLEVGGRELDYCTERAVEGPFSISLGWDLQYGVGRVSFGTRGWVPFGVKQCVRVLKMR